MVHEVRRIPNGPHFFPGAVKHDEAGVGPDVSSLIGQDPITGGENPSPRKLVVLHLPGDGKGLALDFESLLIEGLGHEHPVADIQNMTGGVHPVRTGVK